MLQALAAPFAHTGVQFIPTGSITAATLADYLALPPGRQPSVFVDGRAQARGGKGVVENHHADRRSAENRRPDTETKPAGRKVSSGRLNNTSSGAYAFQIMSATVRFAGTNGSTCSV